MELSDTNITKPDDWIYKKLINSNNLVNAKMQKKYWSLEIGVASKSGQSVPRVDNIFRIKNIVKVNKNQTLRGYSESYINIWI